MKIIRGFPPNFKDIVRVFPQARAHGVIFAYGDTIFNPGGRPISAPLIAHEEVHGARQLISGPGEWWAIYLRDAKFRLHEELAAHRVEWNANRTKQALITIAHRLSGPLYNKMVSYEEAVRLIENKPVQFVRGNEDQFV